MKEKQKNQDEKVSKVIDLDRKLRKIIAEYYYALIELGDTTRSVQMLADHVTILVEMIKELKDRPGK